MLATELISRLKAEGLYLDSRGLDEDLRIDGVTVRSGEVKTGYLFVCIRGLKLDGHNFAEDAVKRGAGLLVVERFITLAVPQILVRNSRRAAAVAASLFHNDPWNGLVVVGVTGTNGKTTTTYITKAIMDAHGLPAGILGTNAYIWPGHRVQASHTTPEAEDIQEKLSQFASSCCRAAIMEVSSHAIDLARVSAMEFDVVVFTNLSRDHLDFHGDMRSYFETKFRFIKGIEEQKVKKGQVVVNSDDSYGRRIISWATSSISERLITYGLSDDAHVRPVSFSTDFSGTRAVVKVMGGEFKVRLKLPGEHNLSNLMAALAASCAAGVRLSEERLNDALDGLEYVEGRFQPVRCGQPFSVIVDYAHSPAALELLINNTRRLMNGLGRIIIVFGAGGDRDKGKRPQMGAAASRLADLVIITSDNPRSEDPIEIIEQILKGIDKKNVGKVIVEPDREKAIRKAIRLAESGDAVLVAGKGHEKYQIIGDKKIHFDDVEKAEEALRRLGYGRR